MAIFFNKDFIPLSGKNVPFGVQVSGGPKNKPEVSNRFQWPEFNVPFSSAVRIANNKYDEKSSIPELVEGKIGDNSADGVKIDSSREKLTAFSVSNSTDYILSNADIILSGIGENDFAGVGAGVLAEDKSSLTVKNSTIVTNGAARACTTSTKGSTLKVYNSTLISNGGPIPEDFTLKNEPGAGMLKPPPALELSGTSRAHLSVDNSKAYFYDCRIISDGWAALSTDAAKGYIYLEANNCDIELKNPGYATYSDDEALVVFNNCRIKSASHIAIVDKAGCLELNNVSAVSGRYGVLLHSVFGQPTMVAELSMKGGKFESSEEFFLIKSANTYIDITSSQIKSKKGILVRSVKNPDPVATKLESSPVFGNNIILNTMNVEGDIINEDFERTMAVTMICTTLKGAIKDSYITIDSSSQWIASGDSTVIIVGDISPDRMDAAQGITITAGAGEGCTLSGSYKLKSGGNLVVIN